MIYQGDTVRLIVNFRTFDGQAIDPDNVTLTIYDETETQIEQFILDDTNRKDVGIFFYDYVTPDVQQELIYEFKGVHNHNPIIVRDSIETSFK